MIIDGQRAEVDVFSSKQRADQGLGSEPFMERLVIESKASLTAGIEFLVGAIAR